MSTARLFLWSQSDDTVLLDDRSQSVPRFTVGRSARVPPLAQCWCERRGIRARVITLVGGLGRRDGSVDWGVWVRLDEPVRGYRALPLEVFARDATDETDRQLAAALENAIHARSSWIGFRSAWPEIVRHWVARETAARHVSDLFPLRADPTAIVVRCTADDRQAFFTTRPFLFNDPELCDELRALSPGAFPRTLACHSLRGWWLTADAGGQDAARYVKLGNDRAGSASRVLSAIADVQQATTGVAAIRRLAFLVTRESIRAGIERAAASIRRDVPDVVECRLYLEEVDRLWDETGAEHAPDAWVHSDPAPDNIRIDDDGSLTFIDLADPWYGPAPLMGALALHSMSRRCRWTDAERRAVCQIAWAEQHGFENWLRLAQLVRLIRRVERSAIEPALLLSEETPRRSWTIAAELRRLCAAPP